MTTQTQPALNTAPVPSTPLPPRPTQTAAPALTGGDIDTLRRVRVLEERFSNLRRKAQLTDDKLLGAEQKLATEIKAITDELTTFHRTLADLQETIASIQGELAHAAPQHELRAIEKYL